MAPPNFDSGASYLFSRNWISHSPLLHKHDFTSAFMPGQIVGNQLIEEFGLEGESVLREATRRYGKDRGEYRRRRHLDANIKINMKSLFSIGSDLPPDPRFERDLRRLIPEDRTCHTLRCPMAELWKKEGYGYVGRLYCEEFHPACYRSYAFGYTKVGLAKTQTQEGDEYCSFHIVLRPENLPEDLKPICFEQYDPYYTGQTHNIPRPNAKDGFNFLTVRVYYYMVQTAFAQFGEDAFPVIRRGLEKAAAYSAEYLLAAAKAMNRHMDRSFAEANFPLYQDPDQDPLWNQYNKVCAKALLKEAFYPYFKKALNI